MSSKKNVDIDQVNMSFTLTDDSESIINGMDQNNIIYNIDCIEDSSFLQGDYQQYIIGQDDSNLQQTGSIQQEQQKIKEVKKQHSSQITFGKGLPTSSELNSSCKQMITNNNANKSQFKNYKQYIVSKDKIQDEKKNTSKKPQQMFNNQDNNQCQQSSSKSSNSVTIIGNKLDKNKVREFQSGQLQPPGSSSSNNNLLNNNSQSNLRSSTTHDETQSTHVMTCLMEKTQIETVEFLKKQLIIIQQENERINYKLIEKEETIQEMNKNQIGLREGLTIRDYEQTISKQAIELIQLRQTSEQYQKENKQLSQEIVKNKAESFQKYDDLKQNNEQLLEAYEEKFQCQLKLVSDNFTKQIHTQEEQHKQDQQIINNLKLQNEKSLNRISYLEKENQKFQTERDQLSEQNEKYQTIIRYIDGSHLQNNVNFSQPQMSQQQQTAIIEQIAKGDKSTNSNNISNAKSINKMNSYINNSSSVNNTDNINSTNNMSTIPNTINNNSSINNGSTNLNNSKVKNCDTNKQEKISQLVQQLNQISLHDLQKMLEQQQQQQHKINEDNSLSTKYNNSSSIKDQASDVNISFQNLQFNKGEIYTPRLKTEEIESSARADRNNLQMNKSAVIKSAKQLLSPQLLAQPYTIDEEKNNSQSKIHNIQSYNQDKSIEQNSQDQENSFITTSQKQQQKQFQLQLGSIKMAQQQQQQYSYSTQITKRNHYLQQNISHRHYPSQTHQNANLSLTERYGSPLSSRGNQQQGNQSGLNQSQLLLQQAVNHLNQNQSATKQQNQQPIQKKASTKNMNSSNNGIQDINIFQHETIKGYLTTSSGMPQYPSNNRDKDNKNPNKYIQAKKMKGINSQEQRSFYNTINTCSNSNSLLIPSVNRTSINEQNNYSHNKSLIKQSKSPQHLNNTTYQNQLLQDQVSHEKFQQVLENQRNIANSPPSMQNLQKMTKALSYQKLMNAQSNYPVKNMNKQNINTQSISQLRGIPLHIPEQVHSQSQDNQEAFCPRIYTSRSTNTNKSNQTMNIMSQSKIQDKHFLSQQSGTILESPDIQRQERSTSNSTFKPNCSDWEDYCSLKLQKSPINTLNNQIMQQAPKNNKYNTSVNKVNAYQKIKNQILQQQQHQQQTDSNNSDITQI